MPSVRPPPPKPATPAAKAFSSLRDRLSPVKNPAKPGPLGITDIQLRAALKKHMGIQALAAQELGCDRANVNQRIKNSPDLQAFVQEIEKTIMDATEGGLYELIVKKKDPATLRWYAERKGRDRGYSTKVELAPPTGGPPGSGVKVTYEFVTPEARPDDVPEPDENSEAPP